MDIKINDLIVDQFSRSLTAVNKILDKASAFAAEKGFDENHYLTMKVTVDMFPFVKQIQIATDTAKGAVARLSGKEAPKFEDNETELAQLKTRITKTIKFLEEFKNHNFENWEKKEVTFPWVPGKKLTGQSYLLTHALPNFYFHSAMAYALLRECGVKLGKSDFLGQQPWQNA